MAAFITIFQGDARARTSKSHWGYVNTTIPDEYDIMYNAFLPLTLDEHLLSSKDRTRFKKVYKRFFTDGKFLTIINFDTLQELLVKLHYPKMVISNDGQYWQPVMMGRKAPNAESWKENGISRTNEFRDVAQAFANGEVEVIKRIKQVNGIDPIQDLFNDR